MEPCFFASLTGPQARQLAALLAEALDANDDPEEPSVNLVLDPNAGRVRVLSVDARDDSHGPSVEALNVGADE